MPAKSLIGKLQRAVEQLPSQQPNDYNEEEDIQKNLAIIQAELKEQERKRAEENPSYKTIPVFYRPSGPNTIRGRWKAEAKKELLNRKSELMWDSNLMHMLWKLLQEHCYVDSPSLLEDPSTPTTGGAGEKESGTMDYLVYDIVRKELIQQWNERAARESDGHPIGIEPFLTSLSFLRLPKDEKGRLPILAFFNYVLKKVTLYQTRIELGANDNAGDGYLTEPELENYFYELIPTMPALSRLPEHFYPFYVCGAVRKFFFFLDPQKRGRVPIDGIMQSHVLAELMELQNATEDEDPFGNWFAATTAAKIYGHYVQLDTDRDGMLSKTEMYNYNEGAFTRLFIDRVFEVSQTYAGEMDYKKYIEFVLAVENPASKPAFEFFWRVLDINSVGYLTPLTIKMFYRDVQARLAENGIDTVSVEDVVVEIFDMIHPDVPLTVAKKDLERCRNRDTIISLLVDYKAFWRYDNRETLASQQLAAVATPGSNNSSTDSMGPLRPSGGNSMDSDAYQANVASQINDALASLTT